MWHLPWTGNPLRAVPCHHIQTASSRRHQWCRCARSSQTCRGKRPPDPASKPRISPLCCRLSCEWQARWLKPAPHSLQGRENEGRLIFWDWSWYIAIGIIVPSLFKRPHKHKTTKTKIHYNQDEFKKPLGKQADHGKKHTLRFLSQSCLDWTTLWSDKPQHVYVVL